MLPAVFACLHRTFARSRSHSPPPAAASTVRDAADKSHHQSQRGPGGAPRHRGRREGQFVPDLKQNDFRVFEDKIEQKISVFSHDDIPVTMGLVIDNSGSMREKREQVNAAAMTFVNTSNPQDEAFVVNFNDEYYLDTDGDFTSDPKDLNDALSRIDTRGSTALYDAVIGSLDHLKKGHKDKRVLLVITDGDDDASRKTFAYTMKAAEESNATIYAIGVFSDDDRKNDKKMVRNRQRT